MPIFPGDNNAHSRHSGWGTSIKLYDYDAQGFRGPAANTDNLGGRLNGLLVDPALPFQVWETRSYDANQRMGVRVDGVKNALLFARIKNFEDDIPINLSLTIDGEPVEITIVVLKPDLRAIKRPNDGVLFVVNGQVHGALPSSYFGTKEIGYSYLEKSIITFVDCSHMSARNLEKLFFNSRDRVSFSSDIGVKLREVLSYSFRTSDILQRLNQQRREQTVSKIIEFDEAGNALLGKLVAESPWLSDVLNEGNLIKHLTQGIVDVRGSGGVKNTSNNNEQTNNPDDKDSGENLERPDFVGQTFPTYFDLRNSSDASSKSKRHVSPGKYTKFYFDTDATNDYFTRPNFPGYVSAAVLCDGKWTEIKDFTGPLMRNGLATIELQIPEHWPAFKYNAFELTKKLNAVAFIIGDTSKDEPFKNICYLNVVDPKVPKRERELNASEKNLVPPELGMPRSTWVGRDRWEMLSMDEESAVRIIRGQDREGRADYDFYINRENVHLCNEIKLGETPEETLVSLFKVSLVTLAISAIRGARLRDQAANDDESGIVQARSLEEREALYVARQTDNAAPIILRLLKTVSAGVAESVLEHEGLAGEVRKRAEARAMSARSPTDHEPN